MRTIYLQKNVAGKWFVRVESSNGKNIEHQEDFANSSNAQRAFIVEGRHQPYAAMVVIVEGKRPATVRGGTKPPQDPVAEGTWLEKARAAMRRHLPALALN